MNDLKVIGVGQTATVYEWQDNKVIKLFIEGYPQESVKKEFLNSSVINDMQFNKPKSYKIIIFKGQYGIVYDKVQGISLLEKVFQTGDIKRCAKYMANIHKLILKNKINDNRILCYKEFLNNNIKHSALKLQEKANVRQLIADLPSGNTLCHGDFHPGNILIDNERAIVIDFMNICYGHYLFDVARTVFLVQYTPVPAYVENKEQFIKIQNELPDLYLAEMNIKRAEIADFLKVIRFTRKGECPHEH